MPRNSIPPYNVGVVSVVTGSRALNTAYTNNTTKTMFASVSVACATPGVLDTSIVTGESPAGTVQSSVGISGGNTVETDFMLLIVVPPGNTYQVSKALGGGGTAVLTRWTESY